MHIINITVRDKIAVNPAQDRYVCGNRDYIVRFDFDAEWDAYDTKTARFIREDGTVYDQVFTGNECPVPVIADTYKIMVGAFAGNLSTTTAAYVPCKKSILCGGGVPADPVPDVYNQVMEALNANTEAAKKAMTAVDAGESGIYIVHAREVEGKYGYWPDRTIEEVRMAIAAGKTCLLIDNDNRVYTYYDERTSNQDVTTTSPTFFAPPSYSFGKGVMCRQAQMNETGTVSISYNDPVKTPNPYKLTIGEQTYDGSAAVTLELPELVNAPVKSVNGQTGAVVIDIPEAVTDDHINNLIEAKLGVIENGAY